jgi:hypothetical protein
MESRRRYLIALVLGVTLAADLWLLTDRADQTIKYIGPNHRPFHPAEQAMLQPWWSVPPTVAVLLAGLALALWLLPGHRGLTRRLADYFASAGQAYGLHSDNSE